jgi:hypothetical protein
VSAPLTAVTKPAAQMFIVNQHGIVHRLKGACLTLLTAPRRVPVSPNQAWVYKLPSCRDCWPQEDEYLLTIGAPRK